MSIQVNGGTPGLLFVQGLNATAPNTLHDTAGTSRIWSVDAMPSRMAVAPSISNPTLATATILANTFAPGDTCMILAIIDGTEHWVALQFDNEDGQGFPCPGFNILGTDPHEAPDAYAGQGVTNTLANAYIITGVERASGRALLPATAKTAWTSGANVGAIRLPNPHASFSDVLIGVKCGDGVHSLQLVRINASDNVTLGDSRTASWSIVVASGGTTAFSGGDTWTVNAGVGETLSLDDSAGGNWTSGSDIGISAGASALLVAQTTLILNAVTSGALKKGTDPRLVWDASGTSLLGPSGTSSVTADSGDNITAAAVNAFTATGDSGNETLLLSAGNSGLAGQGTVSVTAVADLELGGGGSTQFFDGGGVGIGTTGKITHSAGLATGTVGRTGGFDHAIGDVSATIDPSATGENWLLDATTLTANRTTRVAAPSGTDIDLLETTFLRLDTTAHTWAIVDDATSTTIYTFASTKPGRLKIKWDDVNGLWVRSGLSLVP